jgi:hypothetical protein
MHLVYKFSPDEIKFDLWKLVPTKVYCNIFVNQTYCMVY